MKHRKTQDLGFTLVEVMIGVFVLSLVVGAFILGLRSARQEVDFSDKHVAALVCSQKVVEDLIEEIWLNPQGFKALGIENSHPTPSPVTDGQSIFFTSLEASGGDPRQQVISRSMLPLYNQVEDLQLSVTAERLAPPTADRLEANLYRGDILLTWDGKRGKGQGRLEALFYSPVTPKRFIPSTFTGGGTTASYTEILNLPGGQPEVQRNLADVYAACRTFLESEFYTKTLQKIRTLKQTSRDTPFPSKALYECHYQLAGSWYEMARRSLQFLISVEPTVTAVVQRGLDSSNTAQMHQARQIARDFRLIYETLVSSLLQARANYQFLVSPSMARYRGIRLQFHLLLRLLDLYRVLLVTPTYRTGLAEYRQFLRDLDAFGAGRSPALQRLVAYELANSANVDQVVQRLPNLKQLDALFAQKLRPVLSFIRETVSGVQ